MNDGHQSGAASRFEALGAVPGPAGASRPDMKHCDLRSRVQIRAKVWGAKGKGLKYESQMRLGFMILVLYQPSYLSNSRGKT